MSSRNLTGTQVKCYRCKIMEPRDFFMEMYKILGLLVMVKLEKKIILI